MGCYISKTFNWELYVGKVFYVWKWVKNWPFLGGYGPTAQSEVCIYTIQLAGFVYIYHIWLYVNNLYVELS